MSSEQKAVSAVADRLYQVQSAGNLQIKSNGVFQQYIIVSGQLIEVQGRVINGIIGIGNFWIPRI